MSDDGRFTVVVIALLGNPFSPRYAKARRRGPARALDFASLNVAIYGPNGSLWSLRERVVPDDGRSARSMQLGQSRITWTDDALVIDVEERTVPFGRPMRGRVVVRPEGMAGAPRLLDRAGHHAWWPVAPLARVEVDFTLPEPIRFSGHGYHDANAGLAPLEDGFSRWTWSRARVGRDAVVVYDVEEIDGSTRASSIRVTPDGIVPGPELVARPLATTTWGLGRSASSDAESPPRVVRELEDGPFYSRSLVASRIEGKEVISVHEELSGARLRRAWVRFLVGFRMARAA